MKTVQTATGCADEFERRRTGRFTQGVRGMQRWHRSVRGSSSGCAGPWLWTVGITLAMSLCAAAAHAEDQRVLRVVGVQPLDQSAARAGGPRQGAIDAALYEAVSRVAQELVDEYGPVASQAGGDGGDGAGDGLPDGWMKSALGQNMTPFARSFRIVEDQGSRPVLFKGETDATHEYVVVVETSVDVDKVRDRLTEKGIIALQEDDFGEDGVEIEALGLRHWSGYEALLAALEGPGVRASDVRPLEFEAGRALVHAVVRGSAEDVLVRLMADTPPGFEITDGDVSYNGTTPRVELKVLWTPPAAPAAR